MSFKGKKQPPPVSSATPHAPADRGEIAGADNNAPRVLVAVVLDTSESVKPFADEITAARSEWSATVGEHRVARLAVETAWGHVGVPPRVDRFRPVGDSHAVPLAFTSGSPYGTTLDLVCDELGRRTDDLTVAGIDVQKAFAVVLGDGQVNAESAAVTAKAVERFRSLQDPASLGLVVFPVAVGEADLAFLGRLSVGNAPKRLRDFDFRSLFRWLASVAVTASVSQPGAKVKLPPTSEWEG